MAKSQIIKDLANNNVTLDVALSRLLLIAADISNKELTVWAENELNGYSDSKDLPEYRIAKHTQFLYSGINGRYSLTNAPLPLLSIIKGVEPEMFYVPVLAGVRTIEKYANNALGQEYGKDLTWASSLVYKFSGIQCYSIKQVVPINHFENIINSLKTKLIKILIEIEKAYGCLDELDINTDEKNSDEIKEINATINNYIYVDKSVKIGDKNKFEESDIS